MDRSARRRLALASAMVSVAGCSFLVDSAGLENDGSNGSEDAAPSSDVASAPADAIAADAATGAGDAQGDTDDGSAPSDSGPTHEAGIPGLVGEWRFDESGGTVAHDTSGFGHDARLVGAASLGPGGRYANAITFSSDGDAVIVDALANGAFPRSGTLSLWINPALGASDTSTRGAFDDWDDSRDHVFLRRPPTTTDFQVSFQRGDASVGYPYSCTFTAPDGVWKHVVITWDEANANGATFVDTLEVKRTAYFGGAFAPRMQTFRLGNAYRGMIDQVQLYDRVLSSTEILALP